MPYLECTLESGGFVLLGGQALSLGFFELGGQLICVEDQGLDQFLPISRLEVASIWNAKQKETQVTKPTKTK